MLRSFVCCHEDGLMLLVPGKSSVGFSGSVGHLADLEHMCIPKYVLCSSNVFITGLCTSSTTSLVSLPH